RQVLPPSALVRCPSPNPRPSRSGERGTQRVWGESHGDPWEALDLRARARQLTPQAQGATDLQDRTRGVPCLLASCSFSAGTRCNAELARAAARERAERTPAVYRAALL